jgi:hypothetical protein
LYRTIRIGHEEEDLDYLSPLASTLSAKIDLARLVQTMIISGGGRINAESEIQRHVCFDEVPTEQVKYILSSCSASHSIICLCSCIEDILFSVNCESLVHLDFCVDQSTYDQPIAGQDLLARALPNLRSLSVGGSALKHLAAVCTSNTSVPLSLRHFEVMTCNPLLDSTDLESDNLDDEDQATPEVLLDATIRALRTILLHIGEKLQYLNLSAVQCMSPDMVDFDFAQFGAFPNLKTLIVSLKGVPSKWKSEYTYLQSLPALETVIVVEEDGRRKAMTLPCFLSFVAKSRSASSSHN